MRQSNLVLLLVGVFTAIVTHAGLLYFAPYWATDRQIAAGLARAGGWNELVHAPPPKAGATSVPLANPDSLVSRAFLDLSKGPQLLQGPIPRLCTYWSVSVFAHDTDAMLVRSDRDFPGGRVRLVIAGDKSDRGKPSVGVGSDIAVLLIRCFMRDRNDKAYMAALDTERRAMTLRPLAAEGQR